MISDKVITTSSDKVQRSPSKRITTNRDETIVTYATINEKHAPASSDKLQRNPAYSAINESDKNIMTSLQPSVYV